MPHVLTVTLTDHAYVGLSRAAQSARTDPASLLATVAAERFADLDWPAPGCGDIRQFFGTLHSTGPVGLSNEQLDALLADEIAAAHEPE